MPKSDKKSPLLKLPVDLSKGAITLSSEDKEKIRAINSEFTTLKSELQQLELDRGIVSRQIGQAKKNGQSSDELKEQTKAISINIKAVKEAINALRHQAVELIENSEEDQVPSLPGHLQSMTAEDSSEKAVTIRPVTDDLMPEWNRYVDNHPHSHVYHRYEFRGIIQQCFGQNTIYLAAFDGDNSLCGILPTVQLKSAVFGNFCVSMPYFNYGGVLADSSSIEEQLMKRLVEEADALNSSHIEFRETKPRSGYPQKTEKCSLILPLPSSTDQLWSDIGTKVRAQIKQADQHELTIRVGKHDLLDDFYTVFAENMRDLGTPVYSRSFFNTILSCYGLNTDIVVVYNDEKPISCAFLIRYKETMEIPWASTIREANPLNANMFLYWNVLQHAIRSQATFFDFGRSSKDAGTYKFKRQWGAEPVPLYWHYWLKGSDELPELNPNNAKYRVAISAWQRMPVWLTKVIGPPLVKNLP